MITIRTGRPSEDAPFRMLWKAGFGDDDQTIDAYFSLMHKPENGMLLFYEGEPSCMTMMLPCALRSPEGTLERSSCIYCFTTHPSRRGLGLGQRLLDAAIAELYGRGIRHVVLHPASESLYGMYREKSGFEDAFSVKEYTFHPNMQASPSKEAFSLSTASAQEYGALRERILQGKGHIVWEEPALALQKRYNQLEGGDLYLFTFGDAQGCACAVSREDGLMVGELLVTEGTDILSAAEALCRANSAPSCTLRVPSYYSINTTSMHFGMRHGAALPYDAYLGVVFD